MASRSNDGNGESGSPDVAQRSQATTGELSASRPSKKAGEAGEAGELQRLEDWRLEASSPFPLSMESPSQASPGQLRPSKASSGYHQVSPGQPRRYHQLSPGQPRPAQASSGGPVRACMGMGACWRRVGACMGAYLEPRGASVGRVGACLGFFGARYGQNCSRKGGYGQGDFQASQNNEDGWTNT